MDRQELLQSIDVLLTRYRVWSQMRESSTSSQFGLSWWYAELLPDLNQLQELLTPPTVKLELCKLGEAVRHCDIEEVSLGKSSRFVDTVENNSRNYDSDHDRTNDQNSCCSNSGCNQDAAKDEFSCDPRGESEESCCQNSSDAGFASGIHLRIVAVDSFHRTRDFIVGVQLPRDLTI